jgi:hypothetical protein
MQGRSQPLDATTDGLIEVGGSLTDQNFAGRIEFRIDLTEFSAMRLGRILLGQADRDLSDQFGMPAEPESHAFLQIRAKRLGAFLAGMVISNTVSARETLGSPVSVPGCVCSSVLRHHRSLRHRCFRLCSTL